MLTEQQLSLCARIREHCRAQGWYGPQCENPRRDWVQRRQRYDPVTGQFLVENIWDDSRLTRFAFPPATDEQLAATEKALEFPLPAMLRALYSEVANGGFGPGFGITGARGGYCDDDYGHNKTVDEYIDTDPSTQYFNLAEYEAADRTVKNLVLPPNIWPAHFVHLANWGCSGDSYVDADSGRVYYTGCWEVVETGSGNDVEVYIHVYRQEGSLEDWLESWLNHAQTDLESLPGWWFDYTAVREVRYAPHPSGKQQ